MDTKAYVYILECNDHTYYTGYTTDVENRLKMHNLGRGAKYTRQEGLVGWYIVKRVILNLRQ